MKAINSITVGGDLLFYKKTIEAQSERRGEGGGVSAVVSLSVRESAPCLLIQWGLNSCMKDLVRGGGNRVPHITFRRPSALHLRCEN